MNGVPGSVTDRDDHVECRATEDVCGARWKLFRTHSGSDLKLTSMD